MTDVSKYGDRLEAVTVRSTYDGEEQPCRLFRAGMASPRPLLVSLHTWGGTWEQNQDGYFEQAQHRGWHVIQPHFRGPNRTPQACGSVAAQRDILNALDWGLANLAVDADRIYLCGGSGGGHMTLLMAAMAPARFAAASAWCPISDLSAWHAEHNPPAGPDGYGRDIQSSVGGRPGSSPDVDAQLRARSPLFHLARAANLPLDINHGVHDGRTGSVPFRHSIHAFNAIARVAGGEEVSAEEIRQLESQGRLSQPRPGDEAADPAYGGRRIHLRRTAGRARLTIFEGGHDILVAAACHWLAGQSFSGRPAAEAQPGHGSAAPARIDG